ncbi:unnamed protein product, partial [Adineta ricciae]
MATTAQIFTIIGLLCTPMISIAALVLALAAMNCSLGVRSLYVRILGFIFDYATKIKNDKELSNESSDEPSTSTPNSSTSNLVERSSDDPIEMTSDTPLVSGSTKNDETKSNETNETSLETALDVQQKVSRGSSQSDIQFRLGDIMDYTRQGLEAIVDDEVTKRFSSAEEMAVWNLLTRTQQQ